MALLGGKPKRKQSQEEWVCTTCHTSNWTTRVKCRSCGGQKPVCSFTSKGSSSETRANTGQSTAATPTVHRASWLEAAKRAIESVPGTQTTVRTKSEQEATQLVAMESAMAQLQAQQSPHLESYIAQMQKDIETLRNKAAKAGDRKSLAAEVAETRAYLDRENKRISDLEEVQKSLEEKLTERRSEAAKAKATLQKLEEQLAQELTGPKSSMEVDLGATTPLPPSTVDEEVYKMEREALELLRELHMHGVCQERGEFLRKRLAELDVLVTAVKKRRQNDP